MEHHRRRDRLAARSTDRTIECRRIDFRPNRHPRWRYRSKTAVRQPAWCLSFYSPPRTAPLFLEAHVVISLGARRLQRKVNLAGISKRRKARGPLPSAVWAGWWTVATKHGVFLSYCLFSPPQDFIKLLVYVKNKEAAKRCTTSSPSTFLGRGAPVSLLSFFHPLPCELVWLRKLFVRAILPSSLSRFVCRPRRPP